MLLLYINVFDDDSRLLSGLLYREHKITMFKAAYKILKDEHLAEDAVHNAFENISAHLYKLNNVKSVSTKAYLIIVVKNAAKKIYNKRKPLQDCVSIHDNDFRISGRSDTESEVIGKLSKQRIIKCLGEMDSKNSDILLMKYYLEKNDKVIASSLGISDSAVRKRLERARKDLILRYRGENGEE